MTYLSKEAILMLIGIAICVVVAAGTCAISTYQDTVERQNERIERMLSGEEV